MFDGSVHPDPSDGTEFAIVRPACLDVKLVFGGSVAQEDGVAGHQRATCAGGLAASAACLACATTALASRFLISRPCGMHRPPIGFGRIRQVDIPLVPLVAHELLDRRGDREGRACVECGWRAGVPRADRMRSSRKKIECFELIPGAAETSTH
eukprot:Polyplicarium_translucidae@DN2921_c0_g1_i1.p3